MNNKFITSKYNSKRSAIIGFVPMSETEGMIKLNVRSRKLNVIQVYTSSAECNEGELTSHSSRGFKQTKKMK